MTDHYCVAPWRMEELERAERDRDELRAENKELRKWLEGSRVIIANMQPKQIDKLFDEIKRLRAENAELRNMLEGCLHYNDIAEYDNGVSHNGINEGDHHARKHYTKVHDYLLKQIAEASK